MYLNMSTYTLFWYKFWLRGTYTVGFTPECGKCCRAHTNLHTDYGCLRATMATLLVHLSPYLTPPPQLMLSLLLHFRCELISFYTIQHQNVDLLLYSTDHNQGWFKNAEFFMEMFILLEQYRCDLFCAICIAKLTLPMTREGSMMVSACLRCERSDAIGRRRTNDNLFPLTNYWQWPSWRPPRVDIWVILFYVKSVIKRRPLEGNRLL